MKSSRTVALVLEAFQAGEESQHEEIASLERMNESLHVKLKAATDRIDSATTMHREDLTKVENIRYKNTRKDGTGDYVRAITPLLEILTAARETESAKGHGVVHLEVEDSDAILRILKELDELQFAAKPINVS